MSSSPFLHYSSSSFIWIFSRSSRTLLKCVIYWTILFYYSIITSIIISCLWNPFLFFNHNEYIISCLCNNDFNIYIIWASSILFQKFRPLRLYYGVDVSLLIIPILSFWYKGDEMFTLSFSITLFYQFSIVTFSSFLFP